MSMERVRIDLHSSEFDTMIKMLKESSWDEWFVEYDPHVPESHWDYANCSMSIFRISSPGLVGGGKGVMDMLKSKDKSWHDRAKEMGKKICDAGLRDEFVRLIEDMEKEIKKK